MAEVGFKRKLAAILSADVEGYSRLMDDDEEATVRTLTAYRNAVTDLTQQFRGRVVDSPGDNILAEFTSVVDAVNCAVEIQRELAERNTELPYKRQMQFRIGVNLGDVIEEDGRIYGDGVNIAARVESLAEAGGICISGRAFDQVENKLGLDYEDLGEHQVKNIARPIRVYRVLSYPGAAAHRVVQAKETLRRKWRKVAVVFAAMIVFAVGFSAWNLYLRTPSVEKASLDKMAHPLPDKPSLVVLPFDNLSQDPDQDNLVNGITDQIIMGLSKIPYMFVIAKETSVSFKGKAVEVSQVSEELGVQYVLEGSVQRSGDRIRITAQLVDAIAGHHVWSERYDRELKDIFDLQDDIMVNIMNAMQLKVAGLAILENQSPPPSVEAYLKILKAIEHVYRWTKEDIALAKKLYEEAIELSPEYASTYRLLGWCYSHEVYFGWSESPDKSLQQAEEFANKALSLGDDEVYGLFIMIYTMKDEYEKAVAVGKKGLAINPNSATYSAIFATALCTVGSNEEALVLMKKAIRLNPHHESWYLWVLGRIYSNMEQYDESIQLFKKSLEFTPNDIDTHIGLIDSHIGLNQLEEAQVVAKELLKLNPQFSINKQLSAPSFKNEKEKARYSNSLHKAGLSDNPPLPLPDKPSIAVLPFDNLSNDPEQEYFSDGMTDDLITDLSKISGLFVVARNSTFSFKGQHKKVQQIGKELGVRYLLEGSVRKQEDKVRINAQLIDAQTGGHLWAERYDRDFKEIFSLQDEVINKIVSALAVKLSSEEKAILDIQKTANLKAYEYYLRGLNILHDLKEENLIKSKTMFELAIKNDHRFANAYAAHAMANHFIYRLQFENAGLTPKEARDEAYEYVNKAIELNPNLATAYTVLGSLQLVEGNFEKAVDYSRKAVDLDPNDPESHLNLGFILSGAGDHKAGLETIQKAFRLDPIPPHYYFYYLGRVQLNNKLYKEAVETTKKAGPETPAIWRHQLLVSYAYLNEMDKAKSELEKILAITPKINLFYISALLAFKQDEDKEHYLEAYRKVGLPEYPYSYKGDENNILSKEEILDLIVDRTLTSIDPEKGQFWMFHTKDGTYRVTGSFEFEGTYWMEGNKLCRTMTDYPGLPDYIFFYRNPEGTFEDKNEYRLYFPFAGTWSASVEK